MKSGIGKVRINSSTVSGSGPWWDGRPDRQLSRRDLFFFSRLLCFSSIFSLICFSFFLCLFALSQSCCSNARVYWIILLHEFYIFLAIICFLQLRLCWESSAASYYNNNNFLDSPMLNSKLACMLVLIEIVLFMFID